MNDADLQGLDRLRPARRPLDDCFFNLGILAEAEVQAEHALRGIAVAGRHHLLLLLRFSIRPLLPEQMDLRDARAALPPALVVTRTSAAGQFKLHPIAARCDGVAV